MARYKGKHRKTSNTARNTARFAVAGAVIATPIAIAGTANAADWDKLAQCESSGNWSANTGNGFFGGLQFTSSTWDAYGGTQYAANAKDATRDEQITIAEKVLASQGPNAWPGCSAKISWEGGSTKTVSAPSTSSSGSGASSASTESTPKSSGDGDYTVQAGDTLSKIGQKFGVSYESIFQHNREAVQNPNLIFPGQKLNVR